MVSTRTLIDAIVGAVVGAVLSFIPLSTVLGGIVAGFLEGPDEREGTVVGALAGAIAFLPIAAVALLVFGFLGLGLAGGAPAGGVVFLSILLGGAVLFLLLYTVGLSALGGYLGAFLAREYPDSRRRLRSTVGFGTEPTDARPADGPATRDREVGSEPDADRWGTGSSGLDDDRDADRERDRNADREW